MTYIHGVCWAYGANELGYFLKVTFIYLPVSSMWPVRTGLNPSLATQGELQGMKLASRLVIGKDDVGTWCGSSSHLHPQHHWNILFQVQESNLVKNGFSTSLWYVKCRTDSDFPIYGGHPSGSLWLFFVLFF